MHVRSKLILATLAATALLAIPTSAATARNLSVNERNFELIWKEFGIKTKLEFIAAGHNIRCNVTLLGGFSERTIKKEIFTNQGAINHGALESCTNGTATIRTETMPWGLRYHTFSGTLPRISSADIDVTGARFKIRESGGLECEAGTEANHPAVFTIGSSYAVIENGFESTGEPDAVTADRGIGIPLGGSFLCSFAGSGSIGGIGSIRNLEQTRYLRITLI